MKELVKLFGLLLMLVFHTSCGQTQTSVPKENIKSETKGIVTSRGSNERNIHTKYEYTDSNGKSLIIQNSFPRSKINYTDPNGKKYVYAVFWTRIINETDNPLELTIDFPLDSFEFPSSSGNYMKLLHSDTVVDKYDGTLKSFLDNNRYQSSSFKRTINPKGSSTFYVVTLSNRGAGGILRAGLSLREQNLFYRISLYDSTSAHSLINEKEIHCGSINLKNLMLQK